MNRNELGEKNQEKPSTQSEKQMTGHVLPGILSPDQADNKQKKQNRHHISQQRRSRSPKTLYPLGQFWGDVSIILVVKKILIPPINPSRKGDQKHKKHRQTKRHDPGDLLLDSSPLSAFSLPKRLLAQRMPAATGPDSKITIRPGYTRQRIMVSPCITAPFSIKGSV